MLGNHILVEGAREHNLKNITVRIPRDSLTRGHGAERQREVVAGVRHAVRRGPAEVRGEPVGLRAAVPRADAEAGRGPHRGPVAGDRDRAADGGIESAVDRGDDDGDPRLPAPALRERGAPALPPVRAADRAAERGGDRRADPGAAGGHEGACCWRRWCEGRKGEHVEVFDSARRQGFVRVRVDGEMYELEKPPKLDKKKKHSIDGGGGPAGDRRQGAGAA